MFYDKDDMHRNFLNQMQDSMIDRQIENRYRSAQSFRSIVKGSQKHLFISLLVAGVFVVGFEIISPGAYPYTLAICGLFFIHQLLEKFM